MVQQLLCFTSLPNINQLLYTFATIDQQEAAKTSQYNLTILKCRQLLFENNFVLACPNLEGLFGIYVVAKQSYFRDGSLHEYFKKRNLKPGQSNYLYKHIYEECCYYTVTAKLAPKWNMISNYLVRGRDFLTATNAIDAMHLTININNQGDTSFGFQISRIKLPSMTLDKLDLHKSKMAELNREKFVQLKKYESKSIRVLPSLKRANIVSISRTIHENCTIKNYHDMKRHWKNTYGYRLPESDDDLFYVEVSFFDGSLVFTYPSVCVRPYEPVFMQRVDPGPVVAVFMADLLKTVPTILGDTYKVPSHLSVPNHELNVVNQPSSCPNATVVGDRPEPKYRHNITATQNSAFALLPTQKPILQTSNNEQRSKLTQLVAELNKPEHRTSKYITQQTGISAQMSQTQHNLQMQSNKSMKSTFVDNIMQQKYNNRTTTQKKNINSDTNSFKPVLGQSKTSQMADNSNRNSVVRQELKSQMDFLNNCVAQRSNIATGLTKSGQDTRTESKGKFVPKFTPKFTGNSTTNMINKKVNTTRTSTSMAHGFNQKVEPKFESISKKNPMKSVEVDVQSQLTSKSSMAETPAPGREQPMFIINQMKEISKCTQNIINLPDIVRLPMKRKSENVSPILKKVKTKAKELTNMADYIKNNTLHTLTVPTLVHWLRENSVKCNLKEKKSELMRKVMKFNENN